MPWSARACDRRLSAYATHYKAMSAHREYAELERTSGFSDHFISPSCTFPRFHFYRVASIHQTSGGHWKIVWLVADAWNFAPPWTLECDNLNPMVGHSSTGGKTMGTVDLLQSSHKGFGEATDGHTWHVLKSEVTCPSFEVVLSE